MDNKDKKISKNKNNIVIGLEVHVQLDTASKLFCACSCGYIGKTPNTNVCPVCLGLPGALPVLNAQAVEYAVLTSLALGCEIAPIAMFHRKNYFYPDLPKAYQISQYDYPIGEHGHLFISDNDDKNSKNTKKIRILRLHLEEDAGKLVHGASDGRLSGAPYSLVDYNRGGVPLMEIVSQPDISSPQEAKEYVMKLRQIVRCLGVSDGDMEKGSLRIDANISITNDDGSLGTRVEIKNLNSLRSLERALIYEAARQGEAIARGEKIYQETRHWDDAACKTLSSRGKEEAHDYRYFPDPDLPVIAFSEQQIAQIRAKLPELPDETKKRYEQLGMSPEDAAVLTEHPQTTQYCDDVLRLTSAAKTVGTLVRMELLRLCADAQIKLSDIDSAAVAAMCSEIEAKKLSQTACKAILEHMIRNNCGLEEAKKAVGVGEKITRGALKLLIEQVISQNEEVIEEIRTGKDKKGAKLKFLQGQIMRAAKGQADMREAGEILAELALVGADVHIRPLF